MVWSRGPTHSVGYQPNELTDVAFVEAWMVGRPETLTAPAQTVALALLDAWPG